MSLPQNNTASELKGSSEALNHTNRDIMRTAEKLSLKRVRQKEIKKTSEGEKVEECASLDFECYTRRAEGRTCQMIVVEPSLRKQGWGPENGGKVVTKGNGKKP